jgi:thymidylate kinase
MQQVVSQMVQATAKEQTTALNTLVELFATLNRRGVRYCHWKSNLRLDLSLRGQTDLDLLIDTGHRELFRQVLEEYQVKLVEAAPGKRYPDIENYLGFDPAAGKMFHLHVHYRLVLGEQFVKNYRVPLEEEFLGSVHLDQGVNVPAPELELIILSLRALLKYRDRDAVKDVLSIRSPGIPAHILSEIHWLLEQTTVEAVSATLARMPDVVPADIVLDFLATVLRSPRDGAALYRLRQRVRRALRPYQRHGRPAASARYFRELWRRRKSLLKFGPAKGMTLPSGGPTVALVGVDGSGKTTLSHELSNWLAGQTNARLYYLGSKQPSWLSDWLYLAFRAARRGHRSVSRRLGQESPPAKALESVRQGLLYSHYLSVGLDRYRRYRLGRLEAKNGSIVIFDRFPLEAPLDGPETQRAASGRAGMLATALSRLETGLYAKFALPDLLVLLEVSPEVSAQRKPDHPREVIEAKRRTLQALRTRFATLPARQRPEVVNADLPFDDVLAQIKKAIWASL